MRRCRAASRRGSTTARRTRFRAKPRTWPRSTGPRPRPRHRSPAAGAGWPAPRGSRKEPLPSPSLAFSNKQQPVVQPKRPLLPKLYALRHNPEARPISRTRYCTRFEAAGKLFDPALELGVAPERARLVRGPSAELAVAWAAGEIDIRLVVPDRFDRTLVANLPVQRFPQKTERGIGVGEQLGRLLALEIGVEGKPARIEPLQQQHPRRRPAIGCRRRKCHRMRVGLALPGFVEPAVEGREWFYLSDFVDHRVYRA